MFMAEMEKNMSDLDDLFGANKTAVTNFADHIEKESLN